MEWSDGNHPVKVGLAKPVTEQNRVLVIIYIMVLVCSLCGDAETMGPGFFVVILVLVCLFVCLILKETQYSLGITGKDVYYGRKSQIHFLSGVTRDLEDGCVFQESSFPEIDPKPIVQK